VLKRRKNLEINEVNGEIKNGVKVKVTKKLNGIEFGEMGR
jgi:hypothetical protein